LRLRITPQESSFYEMFTQSADSLVGAADALAELVQPQADRDEIAERMRELEHACDASTHRIMRRINETFVTPFEREDIYNLASCLDDVMDYMEAAVDLVALYGIDELPREITSQVEVLQRAAALTAAAMPNLKGMKGLEQYWIEVNRLENEADKIYRRLVAKLFSGEYDTLMVMKLKDVVDQLEHAADAFEKVANIIETIVVKES
jgi:predicted phosphate transport protein (TIGR00153 family)